VGNVRKGTLMGPFACFTGSFACFTGLLCVFCMSLFHIVLSFTWHLAGNVCSHTHTHIHTHRLSRTHTHTHPCVPRCTLKGSFIRLLCVFFQKRALFLCAFFNKKISRKKSPMKEPYNRAQEHYKRAPQKSPRAL